MIQFNLRFDDHGLKRRLEDESRDNRRSLNSHILHILSRHAYRVKGKEAPKQKVHFFDKEV